VLLVVVPTAVLRYSARRRVDRVVSRR